MFSFLKILITIMLFGLLFSEKTYASVFQSCKNYPSDCDDFTLLLVACHIPIGKDKQEWNYKNNNAVKEAQNRGLLCYKNIDNPIVLSPLGKAFKKETEFSRKKIQKSLKSYGLYKGIIDGIWGPNTELAINKYVEIIYPYRLKYTFLFSTIKNYAPHIYVASRKIEENNSPNNNNTKKKEPIKTCSDDPKLCTVAQLCKKATTYKNGKKTWSSSSYSKKYVEEAKRNGLSCKVAVAEAKPKEVEVFNVASGTGFYVSNAGHLITNDHVITGCARVKVASKGKQIEAVVLARDRENDLAIIKVNEKPQYVFSISKENPYPLQDIIVAGYPFGSLLSSSIKFTKGIVSSVSGLRDNYSQIQIDAAIQPGNSGGPIVDDKGNVVAVAVAKLDLKKIYKDFGVIPENTNFGIKASAVRNLLEGNSVAINEPKDEILKVNELSKNITDGTVHLSCWMTMAQIKEIKAKKVLFSEFE